MYAEARIVDVTDNRLPRGDRWSAFQTLSWVTFGELREHVCGFELSSIKWSREWIAWPPDQLPYVLAEMDTGTPWTPDPDHLGPNSPDDFRVLAQRTMAIKGESAGQVLTALTADIERYHAIHGQWVQAKLKVNEAMRRGHLRVWGIKELAPSKPDPVGIYALIDPLVFTEIRGVLDESRIDWTPDGLGLVAFRGPTYAEVFFDSAEVKEIYSARAKVKPGTLKWLTDHAESSFKQTGATLKQDVLFEDYNTAFKEDALKCSVRGLKEAYKQLPGHLRRGRGDKK